MPRFAFFLQKKMKPIMDYTKELREGQQVDELRNETIQMFKE